MNTQFSPVFCELFSYLCSLQSSIGTPHIRMLINFTSAAHSSVGRICIEMRDDLGGHIAPEHLVGGCKVSCHTVIPRTTTFCPPGNSIQCVFLSTFSPQQSFQGLHISSLNCGLCAIIPPSPRGIILINTIQIIPSPKRGMTQSFIHDCFWQIHCFFLVDLYSIVNLQHQHTLYKLVGGKSRKEETH